MSLEGNSISPYMEETPPAYSSVDGIHFMPAPHLDTLDYLKCRLDHTLPVRIHLIKLGVDAPYEVMDQSDGDFNLQRMKSIEISTIVNQEISFFVRVYQQGHNGKHPSQKDVIDYFDAWNYAIVSKPVNLAMCDNYPFPGNVSMVGFEAWFVSEKYLMLLKDSVPDEDPRIPPVMTLSLSTQTSCSENPPLPAPAKELLWYGHEKKFKESFNIPYSPYVIRLQEFSARINNNNNNNDKTLPIPVSCATLLMKNDLQDTKHKFIEHLICIQIKSFENAHGTSDKLTNSHQCEGLEWFDESYDNAVIDFCGARKDQIELDKLRYGAWQAGARWRHA
ncbi:hypothetical protein BPAE_0070g00080 [Botrytis paeoniae]|uniref:Uncharacterized protein n=1 Tax=Botrytis paeoniae TaxID=278948 RepID=A0A4Z1FQP7_9HELO|nr:hypothetical protein BPAE_0070g00080 [Botrytis paeoniae]